MPLRPPAGFRSAFYDPLKVADAPTIGTATPGDGQASVTFTAPSNTGVSPISGYGAVAIKTSDSTTTGSIGSSSPVTVTGLTNDSAYTMKVWAINSYGPSPYSSASSTVTPIPAMALFGGNSSTNVIDKVLLSSLGNATDFGDMTTIRRLYGAAASVTRAVFGGGRQGTTNYSTIDYVEFATNGNTINFGNLDAGGRFVLSATSNSTRAIFGGGYDVSVVFSDAQYITIASTGNAANFGTLTTTNYGPGACASSVRAIFAGGGTTAGGRSNVINYLTIATTGNSTDFGDLIAVIYSVAGCSSSTRGLFGGGQQTAGATNVIQYITIASLGNSTDFGDLTTTAGSPGAASSNTTALFSGFASNAINYVTISSTGNASSFGDLTVSKNDMSGTSNAHGGLS